GILDYARIISHPLELRASFSSISHTVHNLIYCYLMVVYS
ncbi:hypothetical protein MTR67_052181, partial [Solanum verrucosum]